MLSFGKLGETLKGIIAAAAHERTVDESLCQSAHSSSFLASGIGDDGRQGGRVKAGVRVEEGVEVEELE